LIGCLIIFTTPAWKVNQIRNYAFIVSLLTFFTQLSLWILFDPTSADWQFRYDLKCLFNQPYATDLMPDTSLESFHLSFCFGIDRLVYG
jgi:NADH:ubiquinone oxidoreductase subunit 4 (subunit M)